MKFRPFKKRPEARYYHTGRGAVWRWKNGQMGQRNKSFGEEWECVAYDPNYRYGDDDTPWIALTEQEAYNLCKCRTNWH